MIGLEVSELRQRLQALGYLFSADNADEAAVALENAALALALRRAADFAGQFCNLWPAADEELPAALRAALLDLAAAYFLQARTALASENVTTAASLTSLRLGAAAWGFGGGRTGSSASSGGAGALAADLERQAKAVLCDWRSIY